jgi:hypothetical protein
LQPLQFLAVSIAASLHSLTGAYAMNYTSLLRQVDLRNDIDLDVLLASGNENPDSPFVDYIITHLRAFI